MPGVTQKNRPTIVLIILILAGETIFFLPFVLARIFRPTLLEVFEVTNTELGIWFSVYGLVALISYLLGGVLADRYPARKLMALGLWLTSAGGFLMASVPANRLMIWLYAFWGFTSICLFWAAMIRATRLWGGQGFQGRAFGWLEGGRGAVAAVLGTFAFLLFSSLLEFRGVIVATSLFTALTGILVWIFVPEYEPEEHRINMKALTGSISRLLRLSSVWLLIIIIICAYSGYKITDDFSLFAREVLGFSEVKAAGIGTAALWIRAGVAILAGYLADRYSRIGVITLSFALTIAGGLLIGLGILDNSTGLLIINLFLTAAGIYGVRALYFAILEEAQIPLGLTGMAVGIVSFAGFTPEIFISPWMGRLLDLNPGATGHHHVFFLLVAFALVGLTASLLFTIFIRRASKT